MKILLALFLSSLSPASDHIDGPVTMQHRVADLSDLYMFPTPKKPGFLTVILNTYPIAPSSGHFSEKVSYNFYLRKAAVKGTADRPAFETSEEAVISCSFVTPAAHEDHTITCKSPAGETTAAYEQVAEADPSAALRVYAGMRSDPFFFNSDWATAASTKGKILKPDDSDVMKYTNILSVVLEINTAKLFPKPSALYALAVEAIAKDTPTSPARRMDRLGRPEITNVSLVNHKNDAELRDQYNEDRPFQVAPANQQSYKDRLVRNFGYYDALDGKTNWTDPAKESLAALLTEDFLVVDITKPCRPESFLEIEKAIFLHKAHETCGGRQPNDDIMDTLFTLYIAGLNGERIRDGVDHPHRPVSEQFPYLAEPDLSLFAKGKAFLARKLLGISK